MPLLELSQNFKNRMHTSWSEGCQNLNGLNDKTIKWTQVLKQLTLRDDLHLLTMITWSNVLSQSDMFRLTKAWCSACYNEWQVNQEVYDPLLWTFNAVTVCPRHFQPLSFRCPNPKCLRSFPAISKESIPGYCPWCGCWLGTDFNEIIPEQNKGYETQSYDIANAIGELIGKAASLTIKPQKEIFSSVIRILMTKINVSAAATQLQISRELMYSWSRGVRIPQLSTLLKVGLGLDISLIELLIGNSASSPLESSKTGLEYVQRIHGKPRKAPSSPEDVLKLLETMLLSERKITVKNVAEELGYSNRNPCTIYQFGPEVCRSIAAKWHFDLENVKKTLEAILLSNENPPPSMRAVADRLCCSVQVLYRHFPEICRAIVKRYMAYRRHRREETERQICDEVRRAVLQLHVQGKYPSLRKVRKLLEKPQDMLRKKVYHTWREALHEFGY